MSLQPVPLPAIPADTARITRAAFRKGSVYLTIGDEIGSLFADTDFTPLYATDGAPAVSPTRLALVCLFAFMEDLDDRAAADAVRGRLEWKYALHLPLDDAGFDASLLSDFRARLLRHDLGERLFQQVLARLDGLGLLKGRHRQRTDATHVLMAGRTLTRLGLLAETLRLALDGLAESAPAWLRSIALTHWYERYQRPLTSWRWPKTAAQRETLALDIGGDGFHLLDAVAQAHLPRGVTDAEALTSLRQVWTQQLERDAARVAWRATDQLPSAQDLLATPHDLEARYRRQDAKVWTGYQMHLTETCDPTAPRLITQVETTAATTSGESVLGTIQADLAAHHLVPEQHLADSDYVCGPTLQRSQQEHSIELVGPVHRDGSWQARHPQGVPLARFGVERTQQRVTCPVGKTSVAWRAQPTSDGREVVQVRFAARDCAACALRAGCTTATHSGRSLKLQPDHELIQAARQRQTTPDFRQAYAARAGSEGTLSAAVRAHGARRSRYGGLAKTHLQALFIGMALNLQRAAVWLTGQRPQSTRPPRLACLASMPVAA